MVESTGLHRRSSHIPNSKNSLFKFHFLDPQHCHGSSVSGSEQQQIRAKNGLKECSMCGDSGILAELFQCRICVSRHQHMYCSRSYPNLGSEMLVCNWCLHAEDQQHLQKVKQSERSYSDEGVKKKPRSTVETENKPPKNAFDFLLQITQVVPDAIDEKIKSTAKPSSSWETQSTGGSSKDITGGHCVPKRQRGYTQNREKKKQLIALNRWRQIAKSRLQPDLRVRGIGRRYKLLADVLC